jgi:type VI secretion system protein ImpC
MPARSRLEVDVEFGRSPSGRPRTPQGPMRLLLFGDFSGRLRGSGDPAMLSQRRLHRIDLDTVEQVLSRIAPQVPLSVDSPGSVAVLDFGALDDLHPDRLYERVPIFARLRELRTALLDPAGFERAAQELRAMGLARAAADAAQGQVLVEDASDAGTLQRLLAAAPSDAGPRAMRRVDALIRDSVAPHIVPGSSPHLSIYLAEIDALIAQRMRELLHTPAFRSVETAWRGVQWLLSNLELNEDLQLYLLDVTREELAADLHAAQDDASRSGLARALCAPDDHQGARWALLAGLFSIGPTADDLTLLSALGRIAAQAGGPVVMAAAPALFGCGSLADLPEPRQWQPMAADLAQRWSELRHSAIAPWVGLVAPRVLLRLPYGKGADATERFEFEEQPATPEHETLLWGPGSLAVALLLGQAFAEGGWELAANPALTLDGLPAYTFQRDGEVQLQACAEAYFGERAGLALLANGVMPLLSDRQSATARLMRLQSVGEPAQPLAIPSNAGAPSH